MSSNFKRIAKNISSSIISQLGLTNNFAYFLEALKSWPIIEVKTKKLSEDYNYFSLIFSTSVILSSV